MVNQKKSLPSKKGPPIEEIKSVQFDLFKAFITNDATKVSNTVEVWEGIPKYFFTPHQVEKLRTKEGLAEPYSWEYMYQDTQFSVDIQPALIKQKDGRFKAFFPGITEELIEEALKKIFTTQSLGIHDPNNSESWVRFSLSMIQKELRARKRTRSRNQIKHAILVMSSCIIALYKEGEEIWRGPILQDLITVGRKDYLADTNSQHIARLPLFISQGINRLQYRQFNYDRLMSCNEQLSRWIYKQLIHRYRQANPSNDYHFMYSNVVKNSGLLQQISERKNRAKVLSALNELVERGVLFSYEEEAKKEGRKVIDVKYTVRPSNHFVYEQKAANKRDKEGRARAAEIGIIADESSSFNGRLNQK